MCAEGVCESRCVRFSAAAAPSDCAPLCERCSGRRAQLHLLIALIPPLVHSQLHTACPGGLSVCSWLKEGDGARRRPLINYCLSDSSFAVTGEVVVTYFLHFGLDSSLCQGYRNTINTHHPQI